MAKRKRKPLSRSEKIVFYLGSTVALVGLVLLGYWLDMDLALPAFLAFMLLVTIVGARQERAQREAEEAPDASAVSDDVVSDEIREAQQPG